jgi:hypothetical protein
MVATVYATQKQIEAIAYELAERFMKRVGGDHSMQDMDDLAAAITDAIVTWVNEKNAKS